MFKTYKRYCNCKDIDCQACLAKFDGLDGGYMVPPCTDITLKKQATIKAGEILGIIGMRMLCESGVLNKNKEIKND